MRKPKMSGPDTQRNETDASLEDERTSTDAALQERAEEQRRAEALATRDERARTDERTKVARAHTDDVSTTTARGETKVARASADAELREERATSDARKKKDDARLEEIVFRLFDKEREETDQHLQAEREGLDRLTSLRLRYLAMLGHDLRSLITGISLRASVIAAPGGTVKKAAEGAQHIERLARRMERLVTDLVDTSTLDSGALKLVPHAADLGLAMKEIVESQQLDADAGGVTLECKVGKSLAGLFDHERILQVLGNLVGNAIRFTPKGGCVTLRADRSDGLLRAAVEDTGRGIPADKRELVFAPFEQVFPDPREDRGLGLGLHVARSVVEAHGGKIWVEAAPGGGSRFVFTLPALR